MIFDTPAPSESLSQGDILDDCPILFWESADSSALPEPSSINLRVVVLTQACDLAHTKTTRVQVAVVHQAQHLVERGVLQPKIIREQIRTHKVYGWYFLPAGVGVEESIVDLRDLHTLPRSFLDNLIKKGKRVARMRTPYREHLAQHFSITYARIGLPEPYPTESDH